MKTAPYGAWSSPLSIQSFIEYSPIRFGQLTSNRDCLFWVESKPSEGGRQVVIKYQDEVKVTLTPAGYSVRTRVHEYGGSAMTISEDKLWFINDSDQDIYQQSLTNTSEINPITQTGVNTRYADPIYLPQNKQLLCIREQHGIADEAVNDIVAIDLGSGDLTVLHTGHDFYAHARTSPNENFLSFLAWDHPNMPWNGTQLYVQKYLQTPTENRIVAGGTDESIVQPEWINDDTLCFGSDRSGFYDLYGYNESGIFTIAADEREYGHAMWQLGSKQYVPVNQQHILAAPNSTELVLIDSNSALQSPVDETSNTFSNLTLYKGGFAYIASSQTSSAEIRIKPSFTSESECIHRGGDFPLDAESISVAQSISFQGDQGEDVHAYFYEPFNSEFQGPSNERPPLLVLAHGGPTGSTSNSLNASIQFFTTRGWAVLDVNYSGSTGYGRAYRDRLLGEWGLRDVADLTCGVRYLIAQDLVDATRVAIAGGSAGGYTVLQALTTSSTFKAGACRYGIADLKVLARDTHKFESRYINQLVPEDQFDARSPINHIKSLSCPVIFTQGLEDKIVPPNQARMMYAALKDKGIPSALFLFEGEQHGFRKLETLIKVVSAEYWFFSRAFGFEPDGMDASALEGGDLAHMDKF